MDRQWMDAVDHGGPVSGPDAPDIICVSHLRWGFVYQRPQHVLSRFARRRRVFFLEEPTFGAGRTSLDIDRPVDGVNVVTPRLSDADAVDPLGTQRRLIDELVSTSQIERY